MSVSAATALTPEDEAFHAAGPEEQWSDSLYFGGGSDSGLVLYTRIGVRPNEGTIEGAAGIWLPDGRFALSFGRGPAASRPAAGAVSFECALPFELWRITLGGRARVYAQAEDLARRPDAYEELDISGELRFTAWTPALEFGTGLTHAVASRHYEQPGSMSGALRVGETDFPMAGRGIRDHSWGVRDWHAVPWWRWFGMVWDPHTFCLVNEVGSAGGGRETGGILCLDGRVEPVVASESSSELDPELGCQRRFELHATDAEGRKARITGEAVSVAPLRQRRDGRLTQVNEGLTRLRWDDREGLGISEYLVQRDG